MSSSTRHTNRRQRHSTASNLPRQKSVACRTCHSKKIKCSGGKPCNNCTRASECVYPTRDRQVKVHQSLIDHLLQENEELRAQTRSSSPQTRNADAPWQPTPTSNNHEDVAGESILEEIDWFAHTRTSDTPIWIGEISDAAFATRFRQFALSSRTPRHIPRTQFASDDTLRLLATTNAAWPTPTRAKLLVQTTLQFLGHSYHIVRRNEAFCSS